MHAWEQSDLMDVEMNSPIIETTRVQWTHEARSKLLIVRQSSKLPLLRNSGWEVEKSKSEVVELKEEDLEAPSAQDLEECKKIFKVDGR